MSPCATNPAARLRNRMPDLVRTRAHLEAGFGENRWTGYALAVRGPAGLHGLSGGEVPDLASPLPWYSAGKPITAVGVLRILEASPKLWSQPVAQTLPELAGSYAGTLTLEAILSHQTGLRILETSLRGPLRETFSYFAKVQPSDFQLSAGQAAYDPAGGWWLLGQWIERHTGQPWREFLEKDVLAPGGLGGLKFSGAALPMKERRAGKWVGVDPGDGPGAGLIGSAADLALFYEALLRGRLCSPSSLEKMRRPARQGQTDATFGQIVDFGLGVILNSNRYGAATAPYGFGTNAGENSFGHGGARSSIAFADPNFGFSAAIFLQGRVPEAEHQPRMRAVLDLLRSELA